MSEIHTVAQKYLDNYLKIRDQGQPDAVYWTEDKVKEVPWRHDLDELATVYMQDYNETNGKDFIDNINVDIHPMFVALVREKSPKYLEGVLRTGRIFWTEHFHKAKRIPHAEYKRHQENIRCFEPDTFAVWA
jgi:hypothetical protein